MTLGCNIWMICFKLNWFFYGLSRMLQFSQFVWTLSYSVCYVFINFLLIDAKDRSKISSDQKRFFIALSLYPFHFSRTLPLTNEVNCLWKKLKKSNKKREKFENNDKFWYWFYNLYRMKDIDIHFQICNDVFKYELNNCLSLNRD